MIEATGWREPPAARRDWEDLLSGSMVGAYNELRKLARRYLLTERLDHTLQATALVHEAYLRLSRGRVADCQGGRHFFNLAAREMRRVLIDHARGRNAARRGGEARRVLLEEGAATAAGSDAELVALDEALAALATVDPRKAQVVELRFFGGMTIAETAELLGISTVTVIREWRIAKAWLYRELRLDSASKGGGDDESRRLAATGPAVPDCGRPRAA